MDGTTWIRNPSERHAERAITGLLNFYPCCTFTAMLFLSLGICPSRGSFPGSISIYLEWNGLQTTDSTTHHSSELVAVSTWVKSLLYFSLLNYWLMNAFKMIKPIRMKCRLLASTFPALSIGSLTCFSALSYRQMTCIPALTRGWHTFPRLRALATL